LIVGALRLISSLDKVLCPSFGMSLLGVSGLDVAPAGWGRPQERVNPLVRSCDLFLGIVSRQFGHPTGVAPSGTVEEYDVVSSLRRVSGRSPEILLLFRRLGNESVSGDVDDLRRIGEFRRRIADELLWLDFSTDEEFQVLCSEQLIAYILSKGTFVGGQTVVDEAQPPLAEEGSVPPTIPDEEENGDDGRIE
jgi:hypothetical protein